MGGEEIMMKASAVIGELRAGQFLEFVVALWSPPLFPSPHMNNRLKFAE